ncbi:MAG: 4-hydroxybenzoate octaprenyltransferase [Planctomycetota bacterium]|jgi:4-hydroxybenzoate polyprenyltransferase
MDTAAPSPPIHTARIIAADIKLHHSVFALPFAVLAAFMAAAPEGRVTDWRRFAGQLALVVAAMFFARTVAMLSNRLLDRHLDERNPRTAGRALPSGRVTVATALALLAVSAVCFMGVCVGFGLLYGNWWPAWLGLPVLAWLAVYPLLKRFTALCHLYLGSALGLSPLAAALAVDPSAAVSQPALWLLAIMVTCWVAGFDIIYALQDIEVDRRLGQFSVPARWGTPAALWAGRGLHLVSAGCLAAAAALDPRLGVLFAIGTAIVIALLLYEHLTVARWGTTRMALAFFTLNGIISCVLGLLGVADVLVGP